MIQIKLAQKTGVLFENSQDDILIKVPLEFTKIGIKISGGADSALVAYMVAKYVSEKRPDITLYPISLNASGKAYQQQFAKKVCNKITELTGVNFGTHFCGDVSSVGQAYVDEQEIFIQKLYTDHLIQKHYAGITANPNIKDAPHLFVDLSRLPSDDRTKTLEKKDNTFLPLVNTDKRGVAEHYKKLGLMDSLFPLTRSCEKITEDFSHHCGDCWFCQERLWGFGRLE